MTTNAAVSAQSSRPAGFTAKAVSRLATLMHTGALSTGDVAALRRMDPRHPPLAFFKIEALLFERASNNDAGSVGLGTRWAAITAGLAILGHRHRDARQDRSQELGRALAACGFTELRFSRLLQADADHLIDELPMLARHVASKDVTVDWLGAARLILSAGTEREQSIRRRLARDFFAGLAAQPER